MKFLCLGYLDPAAMAHLSASEIDAIMKRCWPHMQAMYATGQVLVDAGLETSGKRLRRDGGTIVATDGPFAETKEIVGGAVIVEAKDLDDAVRVVSLHPALQMAEGVPYGWRMEVRPIHYYKDDAARA